MPTRCYRPAPGTSRCSPAPGTTPLGPKIPAPCFAPAIGRGRATHRQTGRARGSRPAAGPPTYAPTTGV